ncbi:unnamed protein product [Ectocarpus fasciculatus]
MGHAMAVVATGAAELAERSTPPPQPSRHCSGSSSRGSRETAIATRRARLSLTDTTRQGRKQGQEAAHHHPLALPGAGGGDRRPGTPWRLGRLLRRDLHPDQARPLRDAGLEDRGLERPVRGGATRCRAGVHRCRRRRGVRRRRRRRRRRRD